MDAISTLKAAVERALNLTQFSHPGVLPSMRAEVQALEKLLKSAGREKPAIDRTRAAVAEYRATNELRTLAVARGVCFGACERFEEENLALIEEHELFSRLLSLIDAYRSEPRAFRRCFRGLLHSYISYDGESSSTRGAGRDNWLRLRAYLHESHRNIACDGMQPEWVECIAQHPNLLTKDPASRYASALLRGDTSAVDAIRSRLDVNDRHWLMRSMVLAQIHTATREADEGFSSLVGVLIGLLDGHEGLEDEGLGLVLNRYAKMRNPVLHARLRDRVVKAWGNPWIDRHLPRWRHASDEARSLVTGWFKLHVIRTFFELMSDDGETDQRRVRFWQQFYEQIDDMYFALGSSAKCSPKPEVKRMRHDMGDRLLDLRDGGKSSNNAFIMVMGDLVAVEFGVNGHAFFLFRKQSLPFELRNSVSGSTAIDGLRSPRHLERLTHHDTSYGKWEGSFANILRRHGISAAPSSTAREDGRSRGRTQSLSRQTLREFCSANRLEWKDKTEMNGNLSVQFSSDRGAIADQLRAWGFHYSDQREFWWRKSWP